MMDGDFHRDGTLWRALPDPVAVLDAGGFFREINPAWIDVLGHAAGELLNRRFLDFVHPDDMLTTGAAFERALTGERVPEVENRYRHEDGSYRWLRWNVVPEGDVLFCIARNITAEKENLATIAMREEEAALREQFVAILGHDLRNPLAAVRAAHRLVRKDITARRAHEVIDLADKAIDRMCGLIDDVMDFARVRLGDGIDLRRAPADALHGRLDLLMGEFRLTHPEKVFETDFRARAPVDCDAGRVCQLFSNLVGNAVSHGDPDAPVRIDTRDEGDAFVLRVTNAGDEIPATVHGMLFEPFTRADARETQRGLGLGLFIARSIAEAHGGRLTMTSDAEATVFTFEMPRSLSQG